MHHLTKAMKNWSKQSKIRLWEEVHGCIPVHLCKSVCMWVWDHPMALLSQCLNEHVSSFSTVFENCPSPTRCLVGWLLLYTWHMSLCWFTCRPLINKWGLAQEVEKLSWPICDRTGDKRTNLGRGDGGRQRVCHPLLTLSFSEAGESEHVRTCSHPSLQTLSGWLAWVTKWSSKSTQLFIINLSAG